MQDAPKPTGEQTKLHTLLRRARDMASSGAFENCSEIAVAFSHDLQFAIIEPWLTDPIFSAQLTQLCEEARRKRNANRT